MKSKPFKPMTPAQRVARAVYEQPRKSNWAGNNEIVHPKVLPYFHGDGAQAVELSFYAAPEVAIIVMIDSAAPLEDIGDGHGDPETFRSLLDEIYDLCEETWAEPPAGDFRLEELRESAKMEAILNEPDPDDRPSLWSLTIQDGGTWSHL